MSSSGSGKGQSVERFDIIIRGGSVLDGLGSEPTQADVGIINDNIAALGDLSKAECGRIIDASSRRVTPGFIDIHTHSDLSVAFHPEMESILSQGVTTQVVGNCSLCVGLAKDEDLFAFEKRWLGVHGARITWDSMAGPFGREAERGDGTRSWRSR